MNGTGLGMVAASCPGLVQGFHRQNKAQEGWSSGEQRCKGESLLLEFGGTGRIGGAMKTVIIRKFKEYFTVALPPHPPCIQT